MSTESLVAILPTGGDGAEGDALSRARRPHPEPGWSYTSVSTRIMNASNSSSE